MPLRAITALVAYALLPSAFALQPDEIFQRAAPSVTMVLARDRSEGMQGSGVVVGKSWVVTNCHVVLKKRGNTPHATLTVRYQGRDFPAEYLTGDTAFDTCLLRVPGLHAPSATVANLGSLRVGQRVYAIGAPSGLDLTLTDGLISSIRPLGTDRVLQTSAPISPGSSGGGLFDDDGKLIGITSFGIGIGQALNFAYIADHILSLVRVADAMNRDDLAVSSAASANASENGTSRHEAFEPKFPTERERNDWLTEMSRRLERYLPDREARIEFLKTVYFESQRAGLDPQLILGLIQVESSFRKQYVSPSGAQGYMQVMPLWLKLIGNGDQNLFHLRTNLRFGCTILRYYLDMEKGDLYRALGRYNGKIGQPEFPNKVRAAWERDWQWIPRTG